MFNREKRQGRRTGSYFRKKFNETSVVQSHSPGGEWLRREDGGDGTHSAIDSTMAKHLPHGKVWPRKGIGLIRSTIIRNVPETGINRSTTREFMDDLRCSPFS